MRIPPVSQSPGPIRFGFFSQGTFQPILTSCYTVPEFATIPETRKVMGLPRSTLYELESEGLIRFVRLRKRGNVRGRVLVDLDSVRRFLADCAAGTPREEISK